MSGHILIAAGDNRREAQDLLQRLHAEQRFHGRVPDIDQQGDSTVVVMDPQHESLIPEFERIGFRQHRDEDSH